MLPCKFLLRLVLLHAVLDCASYVRGRSFYVECDHQVLKTLMQKKLRGKLYKRWFSIIQQFDMQILYKPAAQMVVPDTLSRCKQVFDPATPSPDEEDPYFPYIPERTGDVKLPNGGDLRDLIIPFDGQVNEIYVSTDTCDADTENANDPGSKFQRKRRRKVRANRASRLQTAQQGNQGKSDHTHENDDLLTESTTSADTHKPFHQNNTMTSNSVTDLHDTQKNCDLKSTSEEMTIDKQLEAIEILSTNGFNADTIIKLQWCDMQLQPIVSYLKSETLPKSQRDARLVILRSGDYMLIGGLLYHTRLAKSKRTQRTASYQIVLPEVLHQTIIQHYHKCPLAGHAGIRDTIDRLKEHYFFNKLAHKVTEFVQ